jgi:nitrite reductase (NO-forming)
MKTLYKVLGLLLVLIIFVTACTSAEKKAGNVIEYSLKTEMANGQMVFTGVGGGIDGFTNPTLTAQVGDTVTVTLTSGDGVEHGITFPDFNTVSDHVVGKGSSTTVTFTVDKPGAFKYFCEIAGHREAGMIGELDVMGQAVANTSSQPTAMPGMNIVAAPTSGSPTTGEDIARDPTDLPAEIGDRAPTNVRIDLETVEVVGQLADGTTFPYWTFNGKVPGPFFRVRVGDTVEVHLKNSPSSTMAHSVDFHAVTGPGGGAVFTSATPGQETMFTFKALIPGLYVYHCATPMVAEHIANGMYGMILVEPEGGLPKVDREFYVMQGEIYTSGKFGDQGLMQPNVDKLLNETPDYYVLNGEVGALTTKHPLKANVGETVRIFFGVGGPNKTSSFHVIGEIFDRIYNLASVTTQPMTDVQTTLVPPGGATIVEFQLQVPGRYIIVDHALARLQRGLAGFLIVDGPNAPEIFDGTPMPGSGH